LITKKLNSRFVSLPFWNEKKKAKTYLYPLHFLDIPDVIAHRGFSAEYPENTLISYANAVKAGTTALEGGNKENSRQTNVYVFFTDVHHCIDIRLSKDNEIVMMHDLKLDRTSTGLGPVHENNWHGCIDGLTTKTDSPQPIPRFNDVLDLLIQPVASSIEGLYMIVDIKVSGTKQTTGDHIAYISHL
jgi:glycerophosphoryl diester phosphodiesterase